VGEDATASRQILAIQALLGRYAWLVDRGEWDQWAHCFTPDGSFVVRGEPIVGRDAIVEYVKNELGRFRLIRHLGHAPEIALGEDGTTAHCRSYFELRAITQRGTDTEALGSYVDSLQQTDEGWQFAERRAEFDYWTRRGEPWSGSAERS
jgi:ketosteroid isomerase-like protein